ncbi:MAG TPA: DAK2 domain-containing protein [Ktedonobacterales bacterium]|nr:DAK2 domain-containing protein [Ktedonobacterales bacterium]
MFWSRLRGARPKALGDPPDEPLSALDGQDFKRMMLASYTWLSEHRDAINLLNVFPVPDGDTGTNMSLTLKAATEAIADAEDTAAYVMAEKLSRGALMGARGNSGVILSQILRGLSTGMEKKETVSPTDLAAALKVAAQMAYRAVIKPVEGTILTVVRESAQAAEASAANSADIPTFFGDIVTAARAAVARTPDLLPTLKQAGVVDAGGQGLTTIFEGMWRYARGEPVAMSERQEQMETAEVHRGHVTIEEEFGYEVVFLLHGEHLDLEEIRDTITRMGGVSTVVAGDGRLLKVHTHTPTPGQILDYGVSLGSLEDINIENLQAQSLRYAAAGAAERGEAPPAAAATAVATPPAATAPKREVGEIATVVVAAGDGWTKVFESLGVAAIVPGGQTMNPSTKELLDAVESVPSSKVLLLPNNGNVIMSANQVPQLSTKEVHVVPTKSLPQGITALLAFNFDADFPANCEAMDRAVADVATIEITRAVRTVEIDGVSVAEGELIGLVNDKLVCSGPDADAVIREALSHAHPEDHEIITLYFGADATQASAEEVRARINEWYSNCEVEIVNGGQPYYTYIMSVE